MFKRRKPLSLWRKFVEMFVPQMGWRRSFQYMGKRMQRLPDTPHRIALGLACGVQASFTPFFGFHFVISAALAFLVRGNLLASAIGTFMGNPLTFPVIATSALWLGGMITGVYFALPEENVISWLWENVYNIFWPYLVGGIAPGFVAAIVVYFVVRPMVATYQQRRRVSLMERAKERIRARRKKRMKPAPEPAE